MIGKKLLVFTSLLIALAGCSGDDEPQSVSTSVITFENIVDLSEVSSQYDGTFYDIHIATDCGKIYKLGDLKPNGCISRNYPKSAVSNKFCVILRVAKNKESSKNENFCSICNKNTGNLSVFDASEDVDIYLTESTYVKGFSYNKIEDLATSLGGKIEKWD